MMDQDNNTSDVTKNAKNETKATGETVKGETVKQPKGEIGGSQGQEPTTFGDWQHAGRCSDF